MLIFVIFIVDLIIYLFVVLKKFKFTNYKINFQILFYFIKYCYQIYMKLITQILN